MPAVMYSCFRADYVLDIDPTRIFSGVKSHSLVKASTVQNEVQGGTVTSTVARIQSSQNDPAALYRKYHSWGLGLGFRERRFGWSYTQEGDIYINNEKHGDAAPHTGPSSAKPIRISVDDCSAPL